MGHALGIHGHSDAEADVMYPTLTLRNVITERDLNTLFWLYRDSAAGDSPVSRAADEKISSTIACTDASHDLN
jgi:hypothetical protein